jgi:DNA-3-methyladenine glycosylase II
MDYRSHLSKDKKLKKLLEAQETFKLNRRKNIFLSLCGSIMSQQLSTRVAQVFQKRFLSLYDCKEPTPQQILETPFETLRSIGLSNAKANYVKNVAAFAIQHGMEHATFREMSDEEVLQKLSEIKGVGKWTVEMLLMFTLGREDVFAIDDLGIQNAMIRLYKLDRSDKKQFREKLIRISKNWSPYRTYACMHLWHWKDNNKEKRPNQK